MYVGEASVGLVNDQLFDVTDNRAMNIGYLRSEMPAQRRQSVLPIHPI